MELRQLKYFVRIVDLGSVSKAATHLCVAQPALSKQIAALEAELKATLLTRSVRGVTPTEAGLAFYRHAQTVLRELDRIPDEVRHASSSPVGVVSVGMPASTSNILAAPLVRAVRARLPNVRLKISEGASGHMEELLASGRLEMSLLFDRPRHSQKLQARPLLVEELFLVATPELDSGSGDIALAALAGYPLVLPNTSNATRQLVDASFAKAGVPMNVLVEVEATSSMKSIAMSGIAAAILSRSALFPDEQAPNLSVRRIVRPGLRRGLSLCTSRSAALSHGGQAVIEVIQETVRQLIRDGIWRGVSGARDARP